MNIINLNRENQNTPLDIFMKWLEPDIIKINQSILKNLFLQMHCSRQSKSKRIITSDKLNEVYNLCHIVSVDVDLCQLMLTMLSCINLHPNHVIRIFQVLTLLHTFRTCYDQVLAIHAFLKGVCPCPNLSCTPELRDFKMEGLCWPCCTSGH